ncbi:MAG TPA: glycosyltransferase family 2 protein [Leptospiraceae bacterium]|nr:glycosyltransferase family 2 protein [Leptospiraceae bacterium]HMY65569.1 glycosyltransferase family 2 protein [Leptospiraceae bacterium]HNF13228.1 glycosyltransferase family 2 protein [Leptospiraceae bacterium]HNF26965.1 glycosyltransferase family 2 protein [Leptospiraceae bacterium]HNI96785.1 glycosyltransferase family 2 protein [Leptospiraceae bacterium]
MNELFYIACAYIAIMLFKTVFSAVYAAQFRKKYPSPDSKKTVTVLQAVMGGDPELKTVLEKNIKENRGIAFIWLLDENDSEALEAAENLRKENPEADLLNLICPPCPEGINPKLFKLNFAVKHIRTDNIIVLDDDTFLPSETLRTLNSNLENFDLVTGLPCYLDRGNIPSRLLSQFVNNNAAMTYLPLAVFMPPVSINGMCYSMKMKTVNEIQNFSTILNHLTDDLALAKLLQERNGKILQIPQVQYIQTSVKDIKHYFRMMHRWFFFAVLLLKRESILMNLLIFLLHGISPFLFISALALTVLNPNPVSGAVLGGLLFFRTSAICFLQKKLTGEIRHSFFLSLISEILQPVHLIHASVINKIVWRKRIYKVYENDRFTSAE